MQQLLENELMMKEEAEGWRRLWMARESIHDRYPRDSEMIIKTFNSRP